MNTALHPPAWWSNNLLDEGFVEHQARTLQASPLPYDLAAWLVPHFDAQALSQSNEAQLEDSLIAPLLRQMGWFPVPQRVFSIQGKTARPDWSLALDEARQSALLCEHDPQAAASQLAAICEAKAWDRPLDTGRASLDNPHHQLQDYLASLRVRFGMLTNGRQWRLYDTLEITARKTFLQIDLEAVMALPEGAERHKALALFAFFFGRNTYVPPTTDAPASLLEQTLADARTHALAVEENLKAVIYGFAGEDSLFENLGKALQEAQKKLPEPRRPSLEALYENALIWLFRLLFIVYFEDKNAELLERHPFYARYSLKSLYARLRAARGTVADRYFDGIHDLKTLFAVLNDGAEDIDIPLFNGGLFDPARAPLLTAPKIINNAELCTLLEKLLYKTHRGDTLFDTPRDFKNMSVTHLGRIYEGLLEFRFERAMEAATYLEYANAASKGQVIEAYFDAYDAALIRKSKGFRAWREFSVKKSEIYLKSASNSRKASASYYTPPELSQRLVKAGIGAALATGRSLTELKILDNACGSGHFLVEVLDQLTDLALARLPEDPALQALVDEEGRKISAQLAFLNLDAAPADAQILKRALLKRCIYGLDLNPFAVELARLSLWMDSFIFGTPLSFIEHHIQHGNALLGASVQDFIDYNANETRQGDLFVQDLRGKFDELRSVMQALDTLRDTTPDEIEQSKALWHSEIQPKLKLLGRALSFLATRRMLLAAGERSAVLQLDKTPDLLPLLFDEGTLDEQRTRRHPVLKVIAEAQRQWHFFHYEVAFPEAFNGGDHGFDVILGNPPWDKTKFADTDFFPQYHSNYRSLKNTEKAAVQQRLLDSPHIRAAYEAAQRHTGIVNEAYKAAYPLNRGAGDGNLFRFFVERNLGLLAPGGSLNYVLPSALMFEEGSLALRQEIFERHRLTFFHAFENRKGLFLDVDSRYKFALMQVLKPLASSQETTDIIDTAFYLLDPDELDDPARHIPYPLATIKTLSPQQWAMMELRDAAELTILARCYAAFPPLSPDWLDFRRELDMTNDKDLFLEQAAPGLLPLYEGKSIWQFSHRLTPPQYWLDQTAFDERLRSKEIHRLALDLGVSRKEAQKHLTAVRFDREFVRLGFRDIARDTDERTLIFALLPKSCGVGNTVNIGIPKTYCLIGDAVDIAAASPLRLLFALAWFNSLAVDWLARFMIQIHANKTYLTRLPLPQPTDAEILQNPAFRQLARNALRLTLAASYDDFADDLAEVMALLNVSEAGIPRTAKAGDRLRAENDLLVAQCYGLSADEFSRLAGSFRVMAEKRPEYLTLLSAIMDLPGAST